MIATYYCSGANPFFEFLDTWAMLLVATSYSVFSSKSLMTVPLPYRVGAMACCLPSQLLVMSNNMRGLQYQKR